MRRGLVIGKFMPVHNGHIALINFAKERCDELIVSMSYTDADPISHSLRLSWLKEIFQDNINVKIFSVKDDFDNDALPWTDRTKIWAAFIQKTYPHIDVIFSSEAYGDPFAESLGAVHELYDVLRLEFPVSATLIRDSPFQFWDFIPSVVRPHFVKKICLYGPESTGKSTMAKKLAEIYETEYVPEVARELITSNDFTVDDIIKIGQAQTQRVLEKVKTANKLLFCDTDLITTQIYSQYYLNKVPSVLFELEQKIKYDQYFLFDIDVPWIADDLRELGHNRLEMLNKFADSLKNRSISYTVVRGSWQERLKIILKKLTYIQMQSSIFE